MRRVRRSRCALGFGMVSLVTAIAIPSCSYEPDYLYKKQPFRQGAQMDPEEPLPQPLVPPPPPPPPPPPEPPVVRCTDFSIETRAISGAVDADIGEVGTQRCPHLNLQFDPGARQTISGSTTFRPLALYFVLDTTGSMGINIEAVRDGIQLLVDRLEADRFDVQLGLTTFHDTVLTVDEPTRDVATFRERVDGIMTGGGGDANEASLIAMQRTFEKMATFSERTLKAALVVTDQIGHTGELANGEGDRNCDIAPLVNFLESLPAEQQAMFRIYYSVDGDSPGGMPAPSRANPCGPWDADPPFEWATATAQWEAVIDQSLSAIDRPLRGGSIDYPPTSTTLIDDFAELLRDTTPDQVKICLAHRATLTIAGESPLEREWQAASLSDVRAHFARGERVADWIPLPFEDLDVRRGQRGEVVLSRCCYLEEDLDRASFDLCDDERRQTVQFTIAAP